MTIPKFLLCWKHRIPREDRYDPADMELREGLVNQINDIKRRTIAAQKKAEVSAIKRASAAGYKPIPKNPYGGQMYSSAREAKQPTGKSLSMEESSQVGTEHLPTGTRVHAMKGSSGKWDLATVVDLGSMLGNDFVAVCFDRAVSFGSEDNALKNFLPRGYGRVLSRADVKTVAQQYAYEAWSTLPNFVGVVTIGKRQVDGIKFSTGRTGKVIYPYQSFRKSTEITENRVVVNWNFDDTHLRYASNYNSTGRTEVPEGLFPRSYSVPANLLQFCWLDGGAVIEIWPTWDDGTEDEQPLFAIGDYLMAPEVGDNQRLAVGRRYFRVPRGVIIQYAKKVDRHSILGVVAGGCDPQILGMDAIVSTRGAKKLKEDFISVGAMVEIIADLSFRRESLKGLRARVVLPIDQDSELGLQFLKEIEAGSLDGYGQDKKCLYVHRDAIRKISD